MISRPLDHETGQEADSTLTRILNNKDKKNKKVRREKAIYVNKSLIYFTAKSLYMFRVSQHPSSGVLKTVTAASGTGHNIGTVTSFQRGQVGTWPPTGV